eukprot:scaffold1912_cov167-Amphora_coffeaeformis.AAC.24
MFPKSAASIAPIRSCCGWARCPAGSGKAFGIGADLVEPAVVGLVVQVGRGRKHAVYDRLQPLVPRVPLFPGRPVTWRGVEHVVEPGVEPDVQPRVRLDPRVEPQKPRLHLPELREEAAE